MLSSLWQVSVCLTAALLFTLGINICNAESMKTHDNTNSSAWVKTSDIDEEERTTQVDDFFDEDDSPASIDIQNVDIKTRHREVKYEVKAPGLGVATWKEISLINNEVNGYAERNSQNQSTINQISFSLRCLWVLVYCCTLCLW